MRRKYVIDQACLECTLGTVEGKIKVTSQSKVYIQGKLKATSEDKTLLPPNFGACKRAVPNPPCVPKLEDWKNTSKKVTMGSKTFVMEDSRIRCTHGGLITITDDTQEETTGNANFSFLAECTPCMAATLGKYEADNSYRKRTDSLFVVDDEKDSGRFFIDETPLED